MSKTKIIIIVAVVLVIAGVSLYYFWWKPKKEKAALTQKAPGTNGGLTTDPLAPRPAGPINSDDATAQVANM